MHYADFSSEVEPFVVSKSNHFRNEIYKQILFLKIKPKQYDDLFCFEDYKTNLDWGSAGLKSLIDNFRGNEGDLNKAIAFYFMFHHVEPWFPAARNLDFHLFGNGTHIGAKFPEKGFDQLPSQKALSVANAAIDPELKDVSGSNRTPDQSGIGAGDENSEKIKKPVSSTRKLIGGISPTSALWIFVLVCAAMIGALGYFNLGVTPKQKSIAGQAISDKALSSDTLTLKIDTKAQTVRVGDELKFSVFSNRKCELQIFYITSDLNVRSFSPKLIGDTYLNAGEVRTIPRSGWGPVQFSAAGNDEVLVAICRVGGLRGTRLSVERVNQLLTEYKAITLEGISQYLIEGTQLDTDPSKDIKFLSLDDQKKSELLGNIAIETMHFKVLPWQENTE